MGGVARGGVTKGEHRHNSRRFKGDIYNIWLSIFHSLDSLVRVFCAQKSQHSHFQCSINSVAGRDCPADGGPC